MLLLGAVAVMVCCGAVAVMICVAAVAVCIRVAVVAVIVRAIVAIVVVIVCGFLHQWRRDTNTARGRHWHRGLHFTG